MIGERARAAAVIEDVRWRRKQFRQPWSELPAELLEGAVRLSAYDLPRCRSSTPPLGQLAAAFDYQQTSSGTTGGEALHIEHSRAAGSGCGGLRITDQPALNLPAVSA